MRKTFEQTGHINTTELGGRQDTKFVFPRVREVFETPRAIARFRQNQSSELEAAILIERGLVDAPESDPVIEEAPPVVVDSVPEEVVVDEAVEETPEVVEEVPLIQPELLEKVETPVEVTPELEEAVAESLAKLEDKPLEEFKPRRAPIKRTTRKKNG